MNKNTALGAAGGIALTVAGGVSALFLTMGTSGAAEGDPTPAAVVTEYVDQYGNPIADPSVLQSSVTPDVVVIDGSADGGAVLGADMEAAESPDTEGAAGYAPGYVEDVDDAEYPNGHVEDADEGEYPEDELHEDEADETDEEEYADGYVDDDTDEMEEDESDEDVDEIDDDEDEDEEDDD